MDRKWLEDIRISIGPISFSPVSEKGRRAAELKRRIDVLGADYVAKLDESTAYLNAASDIIEAANQRKRTRGPAYGITPEEQIKQRELANKAKKLEDQAYRLQDQIEDAVRELKML